jgi:hypothetical protein
MIFARRAAPVTPGLSLRNVSVDATAGAACAAPRRVFTFTTTNTEHNLILLCGTHHASVHSNKRLWQPILRAYIWLYYVECRQLFLLEVRSRISQES